MYWELEGLVVCCLDGWRESIFIRHLVFFFRVPAGINGAFKPVCIMKFIGHDFVGVS